MADTKTSGLPPGAPALGTDAAPFFRGAGNVRLSMDDIVVYIDVAGAIAAHLAAGDPHPQYLTQAEGDALYDPLGAAAAVSAFTDEKAQDAVGTILTDTATIDFTYNDAGNTITADVKDDSITFAKLQNITDARLLGRSAGSDGDAMHITVGAGLALAAGALTSTITQYTDELAQDATAALIQNGTGITWVYNDVANTLTPAVSITQYTDEMAQDTIGAALTDSTTVDFTYNDGAGTITAAVIAQMSLTSDASGLKLSGDSAAPGNTMLYGTNGAGTKGWYAQPTSGAPTFTQAEVSLGAAPNARRSGKVQITGLSGLTIGKPVMVSQAAVAPTGKGTRADESEMDDLDIAAIVSSATTIDLYWKSDRRVRGNYKLNYLVGA